MSGGLDTRLLINWDLGLPPLYGLLMILKTLLRLYNYPSPRKFINEMSVYDSQQFELLKTFDQVVLSDFNSAVQGDEKKS
ncbi:hypothetical protein AJ78_01584 [Emergomyces pasteurianus Ep9510]|uniref:Uncharacterized protein n=1 Tax=Emergomyces pasteurianus Ep9510 TaxID=1447872 RepID=A0A1J9QRA1_9EURO|nr:hypothetical protein AJ78_01584 [Emergomyces pasteurianus Ep9510]